MKKKFLLILTIITLALSALGLGACQKESATLNYIVDGKTVAVVDNSLSGGLNLPNAPKKDGYDFNGWYLDEGTWNTPLSNDTLKDLNNGDTLGVYALYSAHTHAYNEIIKEPTCTEKGFTVCICDCGENIIKDEVEPIGHGFLDYVPNYNGTKTATCFREGCSATDTIIDENDSVASSPFIILEESKKTIGLGKSFVIKPSHTMGLATFEFYSEDESIATVSSSGEVFGVNFGEVNIRVVSGNDVAICKVVVGLDLEYPTVCIGGLTNSHTVYVLDDSQADFVVCVKYNGQFYYDVEVDVSFVDNSIGRYESGKFIPNKLTSQSTKTTTAVVSAIWRGFDFTVAPTLSMTVEIQVSKSSGTSNAYISLNGYPIMNEQIEVLCGESIPFELKGVINGVENSASSSLIITPSISGYATINNGTLVGDKVGVFNYVVEIADWSGEHIEGVSRVVISVRVKFFVIDKSAEFVMGNLSKKDGYSLTDVQAFFGSGTKDKIVRAVQDLDTENEKELAIENGKIARNELVDDLTAPKQSKITLFTETYAYSFDATVYSDIITSMTELKTAFMLSSSARRLEGSYILGKDINFSSTWTQEAISLPDGDAWKEGFFGYFDGDGYTLTIKSLRDKGIFGRIGDGAVIKNVNIKITAMATPTSESNTILGVSAGNALISDVNITISPTATTIINGVVGNVNGATITNVVLNKNSNVSVKNPLE